MIDKVRRYISDNSLIDKGGSIVISLSGGPDSVALLHVLHRIKGDYGIRLSAFHLNHMLRGDESDKDERFCRELCESLGIRIFVSCEDIAGYAEEKKMSIEAAGRERRYENLDRICSEHGMDRIATAHNKNDNAESVLMNVIRGAGLKGLCGIPAMRGRIIRPFLCVTKSEILGFIEKEGLCFRTDASNFETGYPRNYIRHELIPRIEDRFRVDISENISRMSKNLNEDNEYLNAVAGREFAEKMTVKNGKVMIDACVITQTNLPIAKRMLLAAAEQLKGDTKDIEDVHLNSLISLAGKQSGSKIDLPGGLRAGIEFGRLYFTMGTDGRMRCLGNEIDIVYGRIIEFDGYGFTFDIEDMCTFVNNKFKKDSNKICLNYDKIYRGQPKLRYRREKDVFTPSGRGITKKLKKYLIEEKIPEDERSSIPLLALENEILWIAGYDYSDRYMPDRDTEKILACRYIKQAGR